MKNVHNCQITTCLMFCQFQRDGVAYNSAAYKKRLFLKSLENLWRFEIFVKLRNIWKYQKHSSKVHSDVYFTPSFRKFSKNSQKSFSLEYCICGGVGRAGFWDKNYYLHKRKYTKSFFSMFSILVRIRRFAGNCR